MTPGQFWLGAKLLGAAAAVGFVLFLQVRLGDLKSDLKKMTASRDAWMAYGKAEKKAFDDSEAARLKEAGKARDAVDADARLCDARVVEARRSSQAIVALIRKEPQRDPQGCPVRELMPSDRLRDALQGAAPR